MIIGYFIVLAEPAVFVLTKQVEEMTSGTISASSMGNIYLMITIAERKKTERYRKVFHENNLQVGYATLGFGTVSNDILDYLGLETNEKAVTFSMVEEHTWLAIKKQLEKKLHIDAPGGGIVVHAKGTGMELAEKFMHMTISAEKQMIFIVSKTEEKNTIMQAIMKNAGADTKAKAICFSLPVTSTAGLRLLED